jgi:UDP-N-acetylglucosamine pyrophosphorylase
MKKKKVKYIYLCPVDNILLKLADPTCVGYMINNNYDIVSTYVNKSYSE